MKSGKIGAVYTLGQLDYCLNGVPISWDNHPFFHYFRWL